MFSDYFKKIDEMPCKALLGVAAGLVFLCQIVAMVLVVDGQVEKARLRNMQYSSVQTAMADCSERYTGAARIRCIEQANAALTPDSTYANSPETQAITQNAGQGDPSSSTGKVQGFVQAMFASRQ